MAATKRRMGGLREFIIHFDEIDMGTSYGLPDEIAETIYNCQTAEIYFDDNRMTSGVIECGIYVNGWPDDPGFRGPGEDFCFETSMKKNIDGTYRARIEVEFPRSYTVINITVDRFLDIPNYNMKSQNIKLNGFLFRLRR